MIATQLGPLDMNQLKLAEVKAIMVKKDEPNCVFVKHSYSDEYQMVRITKKKKRQVSDNALIPCYNQRIPLAENKKKDILYLCQRNLIPKAYHSYFTHLP